MRNVTKISLAISFTCSSPISLHEIVVQISLCPTLLALTHSFDGCLFFNFKVDRDLKVFPNWFAGSLKCLKKNSKVKFGPNPLQYQSWDVG